MHGHSSVMSYLQVPANGRGGYSDMQLIWIMVEASCLQAETTRAQPGRVLVAKYNSKPIIDL